MAAVTHTETRAGVTTTEFWLNVVVQVVGIIELIADPFHIPNKFVILAQAISAGLYALSRGQAKQGLAP